MNISVQREEMFHFYNNFEKPQLNITVEIECDNFLPRLKKEKIPVFQYMLHSLCRAIRMVPNFNLRYENEIFTVKKLIPSYTVLRSNGIFNFCTIEFIDAFSEFLRKSLKEKKRVEGLSGLNTDDHSHKDYIFVTCLPWLKFSSIEHPIHTHKDFTIPSFAIGRIENLGSKIRFPLSIQVHHGLVDGIHISQLTQEFSTVLSENS